MSQASVSRSRLIVKPPRSVVVALAWKELREFFPLLMILVVSTFVWALFVTCIASNKEFFNAMIYSVPFIAGCGLAIALPLLTFMNEKESGTINLLAQFPVRGYTVGLSKVFACLITMFMFFLFQLVVLYFAHKAYGVDFDVRGMFAFLAALATCTFGASLIGAMFFQTSIGAIVASVGLTFATYIVAVPAAESLRHSNSYSLSVIEIFDSVLALAGIAMVVIGIAVVGNWLRPRRTSSSGRALSTSVSSVRKFSRRMSARLSGLPRGDLSSPDQTNSASPESGVDAADSIIPVAKTGVASSGIYQTLLWQSLKQQKWMLIVSALIVIVTPSLAVYNENAWGRGGLAFAFLGFLLGFGCIYHDKSKSRFQFFQQLREHGRWFWLSRITFPIGILVVSAMISGSFVSRFIELTQVIPIAVSSVTALALFSGLSSFAITLLFNFVCKSNVFVFLLGILSSVAFCLTGELLFAMDFGAQLIGMIVPLSILGITWWHAPTWLSGVRSYWRYAVATILIAASCIISTTAVHDHRLQLAINSVVIWDQYEAANRMMLDQELKGLEIPKIDHEPDRFRELLGQMSVYLDDATKQKIRDWKQNPEVSIQANFLEFEHADELVDLLIANRGGVAIEYGMTTNQSEKSIAIRQLLSQAFDASAGEPIRQFELIRTQQMFPRVNGYDPAFFNRLLDWIVDPDRTSSELARAIEILKDYRPGGSLRGQQDAAKRNGPLTVADLDHNLISHTIGELGLIPWERKRLAILLDAEMRVGDDIIMMLERLAQPGESYDEARVTELRTWKTRTFFSDLINSPWSARPEEIASMVNQDRYLMVRAALEIHRQREGVYPLNLVELVPKTLDVLPITVWGDRFGYVHPGRREGFTLLYYRDAVGFLERPMLLLDHLEAKIVQRGGDIAANRFGYEIGFRFEPFGPKNQPNFGMFSNLIKSLAPDETIFACTPRSRRLDNWCESSAHLSNPHELDESDLTLKGNEPKLGADRNKEEVETKREEKAVEDAGADGVESDDEKEESAVEDFGATKKSKEETKSESGNDQ